MPNCLKTVLLALLWLPPAAAGVELVHAELHANGAATASINGKAAAGTSIPYFPSAADALGRQGFARVVNLSNRDGEASITAFDDSGRRHGPVTLTLDALETVHLNSGDLEDGNAGKGLAAGVGRPTEGDWRLELTSALDLKVLSYIRTSDGFVTSMHDLAPSDANSHRIAFFNPGSNFRQESLLRIVNPGDGTASVSIRGVDDQGAAAPGGTVRLSIPPRAARTYSAAQLESGAPVFTGRLGDGAGKWRLTVEADAPIRVMSLLATPTGHLTNLSTAPGGAAPGDSPSDGRLPAPVIEVTGDREFTVSWNWSAQAGETYAFDYGPRFDGGAWQEDCDAVTYNATGEDTITVTYTTNADIPAGTLIEARYRYRNGPSCASGSPGDWSRVGKHTVPGGLAPPDQASFDARYVGKRFLTGDDAYSLDIVSAGRFRENIGGASYPGGYAYRNTGPNAARVELNYDDGDRCTLDMTFERETSGTADWSCNDGTRGTANWRVVDIPSGGGGGGGGGTDSYCRDDDDVEPGDQCDIYNTSYYFEVRSDGRGCANLFGSPACASQDLRQQSGSTLIDASRNADNSWTIDDVEPEPED
ncbi:MAG: hypothetical protein OXU70_09400 [Gammaproteobacteria bacterium]|nr:hypothetical protein [Gammaproteobacteria bacterium]